MNRKRSTLVSSMAPALLAGALLRLMPMALIPLLTGCHGGSTKPSILSFTASKPSVSAGRGTTLTAVYSGGSGVVDPGVGPIASGKPVSTGPLAKTSTFRLTVTGEDDAPLTRYVTVQVVPAPLIQAFTATPDSLLAGGHSRLECRFTGGTGVVNPGNHAVVDGAILDVSPTASTEYILTVTNALGDTAVSKVTVSLGIGMTVSISGLPDGAVPDVLVTGPQGFARHLSGPQTLQGIPDGEYTISASAALDPSRPGLGRENGGLLGPSNLAHHPLKSVQTVNTQGGTAMVHVEYPAPTLTLAVPSAEDPRIQVPMDFVLVPGGEFIMGSDLAEDNLGQIAAPAHPVTIGEAFYVARTELTQAQWKAVLGAANNPSAYQGDALPVQNVSWDEVRAPGTGFLDLLNTTLPGHGIRLPSEVEWESFYRAGTAAANFFGDDLAPLSTYAVWGAEAPSSVASRAPNPWGLFDVAGNVWEWVEDDTHHTYIGRPLGSEAWIDDPRGPFRGLRGGSWFNGPLVFRSAMRGYYPSGDSGDDIGLRLVMPVPGVR